jgi:hypothetical protein
MLSYLNKTYKDVSSGTSATPSFGFVVSFSYLYLPISFVPSGPVCWPSANHSWGGASAAPPPTTDPSVSLTSSTTGHNKFPKSSNSNLDPRGTAIIIDTNPPTRTASPPSSQVPPPPLTPPPPHPRIRLLDKGGDRWGWRVALEFP